jgi:hypothetical protein
VNGDAFSEANSSGIGDYVYDDTTAVFTGMGCRNLNPVSRIVKHRPEVPACAAHNSAAPPGKGASGGVELVHAGSIHPGIDIGDGWGRIQTEQQEGVKAVTH